MSIMEYCTCSQKKKNLFVAGRADTAYKVIRNIATAIRLAKAYLMNVLA